MFRAFRRNLAYTVSGLSVGYCVLRYACGIGKCEDVSMAPTIADGDVVIITPFHVSYNYVKRGDIVFSRSPKNARMIICKRVVGMEGDVIHNKISGHEEYINPGHVWLEGDNKGVSVDSRDFGPLPYGLLISKVSFRIWPLSRMGFMPMIANDLEVDEPESMETESGNDLESSS